MKDGIEFKDTITAEDWEENLNLLLIKNITK